MSKVWPQWFRNRNYVVNFFRKRLSGGTQTAFYDKWLYKAWRGHNLGHAMLARIPASYINRLTRPYAVHDKFCRSIASHCNKILSWKCSHKTFSVRPIIIIVMNSLSAYCNCYCQWIISQCVQESTDGAADQPWVEDLLAVNSQKALLKRRYINVQ